MKTGKIPGMRWLAAAFATLTLLGAGATIAAAAQIPATAAHEAPAANYQGWGYLTGTDASNVPFWKWTNAGWVSAPKVPGTSVWLYPWGSGWTWAYRDSAWHAVQTARIARWKCDAASGELDVHPLGYDKTVNVQRYNASAAATLVTATYRDRIRLQCSNGFADASGGGKVFAMVRVDRYRYCEPYTWDCAIRPVVVASYSGYVDVTQVRDMPVAPPQGTFPDVPE